MTRSPFRPWLLLLLGLFVSLGLLIAPVHANVMASQMATDSSERAPAHVGCDACADDVAAADACGTANCVAPAVLPLLSTLPADAGPAARLHSDDAFPPDRALVPDLRPPRPLV